MQEENRIKEARVKAGLNIKQLSELIKAPYKTVQDWNAGRRTPPVWLQDLIIEKIQSTAH